MQAAWCPTDGNAVEASQLVESSQAMGKAAGLQTLRPRAASTPRSWLHAHLGSLSPRSLQATLRQSRVDTAQVHHGAR